MSQEANTVQQARDYLSSAPLEKWDMAARKHSVVMTGPDYQKVWRILRGA